MIFKLNPVFVVRNEDNCSYLIRRNGMTDSSIAKDIPSVTLLPPAIGCILENIGQMDSELSIAKMSQELQVTKESISAFLRNLMQDTPKKLKIGEYNIIFPPHLIVCSEVPSKKANNYTSQYISSIPQPY